MGLAVTEASETSYIVVNYKANSIVRSVWLLWSARDDFFSPRPKNSNARSLDRAAAAKHIEVILTRGLRITVHER